MKVKYLQDLLAALPPCLDIRRYYVYAEQGDTTYFQIDIENLPLNIPGLYSTVITLEKERGHKHPVGLIVENFIHTLDGDILLQAKVKFEDIIGKKSYMIDHFRYLMPEIYDKIHDPLINCVNNSIKNIQESIKKNDDVYEIVRDKKIRKTKETDYRVDMTFGLKKGLERLKDIKDKLLHPKPLTI